MQHSATQRKKQFMMISVDLLLILFLEMKDKRQAWCLASAHTCFNSFVTEELNWFYIIEFFRCYELIIWVPNRFKLSAVSAAYPHNILHGPGGHSHAPVIPSVKWRTTSFLSNLAFTASTVNCKLCLLSYYPLPAQYLRWSLNSEWKKPFHTSTRYTYPYYCFPLGP